MEAYEEVIRTNVVRADNQWFARPVVAAVMVDKLRALDIGYPKVKGPLLRALAKVRRALETEGKRG